MKTYKGFKKDMTCRGFQYEEGKEYEEDEAKACEKGFHGCEYPLDCFSYYPPSNSVFHEVEQDGIISKNGDDTKVASSKIKIGAEVGIPGLVKSAIEYTKANINKEAKADEDCGASSATGNRGASSATGYCGASSATGNRGASSATGDCGASSATGKCSAATSTGCGCTAEANNPTAIAVAWGIHGRAKGVKGARLVLTDWVCEDDNRSWDMDAWTLKGSKMIRIDGKKYKADTWYTMKDGKVVEWSGA